MGGGVVLVDPVEEDGAGLSIAPRPFYDAVKDRRRVQLARHLAGCQRVQPSLNFVLNFGRFELGGAHRICLVVDYH